MPGKGGGPETPRRRGGAGRQDAKRSHGKPHARLRHDDSPETNWTKKFEAGELDELLVTGDDEESDEWTDSGVETEDADALDESDERDDAQRGRTNGGGGRG